MGRGSRLPWAALLLIGAVLIPPLTGDAALAVPDEGRMLRAVGLAMDDAGHVVRVGVVQPNFLAVFARSFEIAVVVTLACVLLGVTIAAAVARLGPWARTTGVVALAGLWIASLTRAAWFIRLQHEAPVMGSRAAVCLAMVIVLLPCAFVPTYRAMRGIDPAHLRSAASLGASGVQRFRRVVLPLSLRGAAWGALTVFALSLGLYAIPGVLGGDSDQMAGAFIARYARPDGDPGMAAALAIVLLAIAGGIAVIARLLLGGSMTLPPPPRDA